MGQMVYVLMMLEGTGKVQEWRPQAVVTDPTVAEQWGEHGKHVDWVPLEIDDVASLYSGGEEKAPRFRPQKDMAPVDQRAVETARRLEATNKRLLETIKLLYKKLGIKEELPPELTGKQSSLPEKNADRTLLPQQTTPQSGVYGYDPTLLGKTKPIAEDPLMKSQAPSWVTGSAEDKTPPKPEGFAETLGAQEIADYIETYAAYEVDNEFVYEKFRGTHAVLKLVPIAELQEGDRDANPQNKENEDKYLKQDSKTQPPVIVENGKVLDGNHRLRADKRRGLTHMWCYVVIEGD